MAKSWAKYLFSRPWKDKCFRFALGKVDFRISLLGITSDTT